MHKNDMLYKIHIFQGMFYSKTSRKSKPEVNIRFSLAAVPNASIRVMEINFIFDTNRTSVTIFRTI